MDIAERLAQVGEEIQHVENDLCDRRRLLTAFWRHLRPVNPAVVGDRMRATDQRKRASRGGYKCCEMNRIIVRAVTLGDRGD